MIEKLEIMLSSDDGGYSLSKILLFTSFMIPMSAWCIVGLLILAEQTTWDMLQGWFIAGGGLVFGGILSHGTHRATWKGGRYE